jgi:hypothetical protein
MQIIEKTSDKVVVEESSHVATTNEIIHIMVDDQVGASVQIKKPIHLTTNESRLDLMEDLIHVVTNGSNPLAIKD